MLAACHLEYSGYRWHYYLLGGRGLGELAIRRCQHGAVRVIATAKLYQQFAANILARSLLDHHIGQCAKKTQGAAI